MLFFIELCTGRHYLMEHKICSEEPIPISNEAVIQRNKLMWLTEIWHQPMSTFPG